MLTLAIGFVLRAGGGAAAVGVPISHWLLSARSCSAPCSSALSKRAPKSSLLADDATAHRRILGEYSPYLLDQMIGVVTASTLMAYAFYTISPETVARSSARSVLVLTVPFPLYGIFRYLYLVHQRTAAGVRRNCC